MHTDWLVELVGSIPGIIFAIIAIWTLALAVRHDYKEGRKKQND